MILFLEREKERGRRERRRRYGGDVVREGREFYDIILGKREGGRGGEDKLKSAMRIKKIFHDIVFFENAVFGRWKLCDMDKNMDINI